MKQQRQLRVDDRFPLSWCEEAPKNEHGYRIKSVSVGRRVWGRDIGKAILCISADSEYLILSDAQTGQRIQVFRTNPTYSSPWGDMDALNRLRQVAEWHEAAAFNAALDLLTVGAEDAPAVRSLCGQEVGQ